MKEENKKSKKKVLLYYLILAACLLVIAAVTVTVIFTVNRGSSDITIDKNQPDDGDNKDPDDNNPPDSGDNEDPDKDPDKPTGSLNSFILPVTVADVTNKFAFGYDVTLDRYCVHRGMDFNVSAGSDVYAVMDGNVSKIVTNHVLGENYITVTHANGISSTYKYIDVNENIKEGHNVSKGDVLGKVASASGMEMKQGDHLHFEIRVNGKLADPDTYLEIIEK